MSALRDVVEKLIAEVYAGKVPPRVAAGLAPLLNLQLRVVEATDLERRLVKVEKLLAQAEAEDGLKGYDEAPADDSAKACEDRGRRSFKAYGCSDGYNLNESWLLMA